MKEFQASRLSDGNKVMPNTIRIDDFGVTLKIPGVFSGKEKTITYHEVSSVNIETPMVGFSTITFNTIGFDRIVAKGFSKEDAHEVKQLCQKGIQNARGGGGSMNMGGGSQQVIVQQAKSAEQIMAEAEAEKVKHQIEMEKEEANHKREMEKKAERDKSDKEFFDAVKKHWKIWVPILLVIIIAIAGVKYFKAKNAKENAKEQLEQLTKLNEELDKELNNNNTTTEAKTEETNTTEEQPVNNSDQQILVGNLSNSLKGEWKGDFGGKELLISLNEVDLDLGLTGYDEVKGNKRDLKGSITDNGNGNFTINLKEPGDDKWDGSFKIKYIDGESTMSGTWTANNGKSTKNFTLTK